MSSMFGWVDFAEEDRRKMLEVVRLFQEKETRDELGVGTVRNAFANYFFPGTSTIQTRARYFLVSAWIYKNLEDKKVRSVEVAKKARKQEIDFITRLLENGETTGVIGAIARDSLQRLPSSIYWAGLGTWGIRAFPGSQDQYHRYLDTFYKTVQSEKAASPEDETPNVPANWHTGLPDVPQDLHKNATLSLSENEAEYLKERILMNYGQRLLAILVKDEFDYDVEFVWELQALPHLSEKLRSEIRHARNFSETIHGANLFYNLLLAEAAQRSDMVESYAELLGQWAEAMKERLGELAKWRGEMKTFWLSESLDGTISLRTRLFVERWHELMFEGIESGNIVENEKIKRFVKDREISLKGKRSRFKNPTALKNWSGASGTGRLSYRWGNAKIIVNDIRNGLS